jgi:Glycosyl hydrolases family 43
VRRALLPPLLVAGLALTAPTGCAGSGATTAPAGGTRALVAPSTSTPAPPAAPPAPDPTGRPSPPPSSPVAAASARAGAPAAARRPLPQPLPEPNRVAPASSPAAGSVGGAPALWPGDFPDPFVILVRGPAGAGSLYYAYATQAGTTEVQTIRSPDLARWEWVGEALPRLPAWAVYGYLWGPSVLARSAGYVLYYATRQAATGRQCISLAVSLLPQGPFVDTSDGPFICQLDRGGSIDPSPFVDDDGTPWLVWKSEGTLAGEPTRIWAQRLSADGRGLEGQPTELARTDQGWERPIVEGPTMARVGGRYVLFYAANRWETPGYAVGYALCATPAGPCRKPLGGPVMTTSGREAGPGGPGAFVDSGGALRLAYHAWTAGQVGYPGGARRLHLANVSLAGDLVTLRE